MDLVESLPVAARLRNAVKRGKLNVIFIQFKQDVFLPFIEDLSKSNRDKSKYSSSVPSFQLS